MNSTSGSFFASSGVVSRVVGALLGVGVGWCGCVDLLVEVVGDSWCT